MFYKENIYKKDIRFSSTKMSKKRYLRYCCRENLERAQTCCEIAKPLQKHRYEGLQPAKNSYNQFH